MRRLRILHLVFLTGSWLCLTGALWAEAGFLVVHVKDVQRHPIRGVQIGVEGDGGSAITGDDGKARIPLAKDTKEKSWASLQILKSPSGKDFMMVSPWDYKTLVPSFENESENVVEVVVVERGDRLALESGTALLALTAQINKANAPKTADKQARQEDPKASLAAVAKRYGLAPDDLDQAIRAWGAKATDPYEAGLAALYERNYREASTQLADSLQKREETLATNQKAVADAACFLGQSLYEEGKYRDSATKYERCLDLRPDDAAVLDHLASSLWSAGDYVTAEPLFRRALMITEKELGPDHPDVASCLNNLAVLLLDKGDYLGAEPLSRRALAIDEQAPAPNYRHVATDLDDLAELLRVRGDYTGAEPLYRRALAIDEKTLGPDDPSTATVVNNLALLLKTEGNYGAAEPLYRRALAIDEKTLGPDHPSVALDLNNLAQLLSAKGDSAAAEPLLRRALMIGEKTLGPDHPNVAAYLNNLGLLLDARGDGAAAEPLYRRALTIDEKALGPNHPVTQQIRQNLESVSAAKAARKPGK